MASPPLTLDNDDEFDWEAAVREIDTACEIASNNQQHHSLPPPSITTTPAAEQCPRAPPKADGKHHQSTLDRFVDSFAKRKSVKEGSSSSSRVCGDYRTPTVDHGGFDNPGAAGGESAVSIDLEAAQTWIYPVNVPLRDYQLSISKVALFSNTLVALPTGLGKTLIAAVVMYNYFRWFPEGKIVFTAPSRPLVMQQIEACHNIVGIPQEWAIDMTGQMSPLKRSSFWKTKRVFFVTPQVLEKDIQSGICLMKQLVCLVIDEAHRAMGNYSYCVAVRELMAVPVQLRILALTATPGSKQQTIQNVIDNLCISTLEYRNETDRDVSPYVHNRTLELIEVEMGKDATEINNLLVEAIKPFASRLFSKGLLYNRDFATLSPCELLISRDKFRQAPPNNLNQTENREIEGCFGVLITLYHIRKLLSSHGIRPAYEMLDEKLRSGSFARIMSRNEIIMKAKMLMQRNLSHGAPNPKLVKMIDILIEHFKVKDPKDSRVIIFSNFRGSVKDIIDSLSSIGDLVKATEFIGQSSGKTQKGQSQKVQQAVLQKFRTGGYNVIVATSIGEEGLDIMEVDLVICFDANVSPLRMIQRMGRTGRKHDGRVVILACEGSEVKGYKKKQASSKAVRKHMHNGGIKSFNFHSSPRMVPHICKPQVQFVELSIEPFIPRGKKPKDDLICKSPLLNKVLDEEKDQIARYFCPAKEDRWVPSLIAFPVFQTFPSIVHEVRHSFRTTSMLIDSMQHLQGLALPKPEEVDASHHALQVETAAADNNEQVIDDIPEVISQPDIEESFMDNPEIRDGIQMPCHPFPKFSSHCFLFGEDFVTVNTTGSVIIASVPCLAQKGSVVSKVLQSVDRKESLLNTSLDAFFSKASAVHCGKLNAQLEDVVEDQKHFENGGIISSQLHRYSVQDEHRIGKSVLESPISKQKLMNLEDSVCEAPDDTENMFPDPLVFESNGDNMEWSPRLTHYIKEGIVPESPMVSISDSKEENIVSASISPVCEKYGPLSKSQSISIHVKKDLIGTLSCLEKDELQVSHNIRESAKAITSPDIRHMPNNKGIHTPLVNSINNSCSENWQQNCEEASKSSLPAPKYKRLRKYGDMDKGLPCKNSGVKYNSALTDTHKTSIRNEPHQVNHKKGKREKTKKYFNSFIEEEADVSKDAEVSEDEEDGDHEDKYDDSFIDDKINQTGASTEAENSGEMLAFYRRSLLTQSPAECLRNSFTTSHDFFSSRTAETGSCSSDRICNDIRTPQNGFQSAHHSGGLQSVTCHIDVEKTRTTCEASNPPDAYSAKLETRKRKLSFQQIDSIPAAKFPSAHTSEEASLHWQSTNPVTDANLLLDDDDFYKDLDLDAVEEQATKLLKHESGVSVPSQPADMKENPAFNDLCSPSFDLGI